MELILNLAWALCSLGLVWFWFRAAARNSAPRTMQILALAMVVVLLLPVISASDDLMAMQGPAESDTSLRRALHTGDVPSPVLPLSPALPEPMLSVLTLSGVLTRISQESPSALTTQLLGTSLDSRPPPVLDSQNS